MNKNIKPIPILVLLLLASISFSQRRSSQPVEFKKISTNLYEIVGGRGSSTGAYTGDNKVLLIDSKMDENSVNQVIEGIRKLTDKSIKYLVNTHSDGDHIAGNRYLPETVTFVAHENCRKDFFDFSQAKASGEDSRFSSGGAPLAYQIDEWDAASGNASIWARIPVIKGNARQEIKLHWGKADEAQAGNIFVAANGSDKNPGTLQKPFATLQRAQQEARKQRSEVGYQKSEGITVYLRGGTYYLPETLIFTAEDSGTRDAPLVYQAYEKEKPVVSGGVRLNDLKWEPYKSGIMQAKVPAGFAMDQLFVNGEFQPMARYPNFDAKARYYNGAAEDAFSPERAAKWKDPAGGFIHALHKHAWGGMHYVITGKGPDNKVTYEGGWQNNRPTGMHKNIRFVENIFEELDALGEWFLDSKNSLLYYCPSPGVDLAKATIEAVRLKHLIEFRGSEQAPVRFISFKGLTFSHAARTFMETNEMILRTDWAIYRGGALLLNGTEDCTIEDCAIEQVGGNAIFVNNYNHRVTVRGCHISRVGGSGVAFIGDPNAVYNPRGWKGENHLSKIDKTPGPKTANYPGNCLVEDCLIHSIGQVEKQTAGVTLDMAQGITIRHCSIYDMPRAGINFGDGCWGGHLIEFCDVFDTVKETGDHGSFNSWGRDRFWMLGGLNLNDDKSWEAHKAFVSLDAYKTTVIRNSRWRCDHGWDIDLDDGSSNYHIYNNLLLPGRTLCSTAVSQNPILAGTLRM